MSQLEVRVLKLEQRTGEPDELRLRSLTDEQLHQELEALKFIATADLKNKGMPVPNNDAEWLALARQDRSGSENNQRKSNGRWS